MSYILDALRKAEAEREREQRPVPNLSAQMLPPTIADDEVARTAAPRWPWLAAATLLGAGVALYAFVWRDASPPAVATASVAKAPPAIAKPPAALPAAVAPPAVQAGEAAAPAPLAAALADAAPAATPAAPPARPVPPAPAAPTAAALAVPASPPVQAPPPVRQAPPARPAATARATAATPPPDSAAQRPKMQMPLTTAEALGDAAPPAASAPRAAPARTPSLAELPEDLRRQVPQLSIGGSIYSPQPTARMLVLNGQVLQEGGNVTPELKLEQIGPKAAVFSIRGQRFEVPL